MKMKFQEEVNSGYHMKFQEEVNSGYHSGKNN